ncbi:MAG: hypothetical protein JXR59_05600 [Desulfuromonadaceae bacterium]|nr:hypothetical protein [Desulfuromonadaceae bacterium]
MVLNPFYTRVNAVFDRVEHLFESAKGQRRIGSLLVILFLGGLLGIEINNMGWMPASLAAITPTNHLEAIQLVFTALLVFEVISLLFSLVYSVSISVGKQVEILSLVMLRNIFKEVSTLHEPVIWDEISTIIINISALALGALAIFVILGFYYRHIHEVPINPDEKDTATFIIAKKLIALAMMTAFALIFVWNWWHSLLHGVDNRVFETFFTLLIFSDILIMLFSMRYGSSYRVAFRNSGFAIATLLIRVALITPAPFNALVGIGSAMLVLGIRLAYNAYVPSRYQQQRETLRRRDDHPKNPCTSEHA